MIIKYITISVYFFLIVQDSIGQEGVNFDMVKEFNLEGNAIAIGNTLMSKDATKAFDDFSQINDELKMKYVDIDLDQETFSSSSALLKVPEDSKIVYAGLYWSGTYNFEKSSKRKQGNKIVFKGKGKRANNLETIKFKMPDGLYQNLSGTLLYDGLSSTTHQSNAPYVCYKDVTYLLNNAKQINGAYTVANVKATQGYISGGSCAGWMLYIVYKKEGASPKYITTHHGFKYVNKNPLELIFNNFKTVTEGQVNTSISLAGLEGDSRLYKDQMTIWNDQTKTFIPIENELRKKNNFFLSTVSKNGTINTDRMPASTNTLGFDIAQLKIDNPNNSKIANGASQLKFRYTTKADRYYLFFTAFETDLDHDFYENKETVDKVSELVSEQVESHSEEIPEAPQTILKDNEGQKQDENIVLDEELIKLENKESFTTKALYSGYYLVTNVFSKKDLAIKWKTFLEKENYLPQIFQNPENNWYYVYISSSLEAKTILENLRDARQRPYFKDPWVFKINVK